MSKCVPSTLITGFPQVWLGNDLRSVDNVPLVSVSHTIEVKFVPAAMQKRPPSRLAPRVREVLKELRGPDSATVFASELKLALNRNVDKSQVLRWERGDNMPGADVLLAALSVTRTSRTELPTPLGMSGVETDAFETIMRIETLERRVAEVMEFHQRLQAVMTPPAIGRTLTSELVDPYRN